VANRKPLRLKNTTEKLAQQYEIVGGFPTIGVLSAAGQKLWRTTVLSHGPTAFCTTAENAERLGIGLDFCRE